MLNAVARSDSPKSWVSWLCFDVGILCMLWQWGLRWRFCSALEALNMGHVCPRRPQSQVPVTLLGLGLLGRWVLPGCTTTLLPASPPAPSTVCREGAQPGCGVSRTQHPGSDESPATFPARIPGQRLPPRPEILPVRGRNGCYFCSSLCRPGRSAPSSPVTGL